MYILSIVYKVIEIETIYINTAIARYIIHTLCRIILHNYYIIHYHAFKVVFHIR